MITNEKTQKVSVKWVQKENSEIYGNLELTLHKSEDILVITEIYNK
jgi:hypothetical protein